MPPSTATPDRSNRVLSDSPRNTTAPSAAITGTLSCTMPAWVTARCLSARYQMA